MPDDVSPLILVVLAPFLAIVVVGPLVWYFVVRRLVAGTPVLEHEPRRLASWGFIDFLIVVFLLIVFTTGGVALAEQATGLKLFDAARSSGSTKSLLYLMLISSVSQLLAAALTGLFIMLRTRATPADLGFSLADVGRDLRLGGAAFCALAIPTYALQGLLVQFWKSEHPLIESLKAERDPQFLAIAMFAAVISAPLTEEFVFRVLFQGWLEKMFDPLASRRPNFIVALFIGERVQSGALEAEVLDTPEPGIRFLDAEVVSSERALINPYVSPAGVTTPPTAFYQPEPPFPTIITDILAITISSAIFAGLHFAHGPDWIPLFGLAIGLGYLYRRTHRILPCLVVHFLLNFTSMLALCAEIYK